MPPRLREVSEDDRCPRGEARRSASLEAAGGERGDLANAQPASLLIGIRPKGGTATGRRTIRTRRRPGQEARGHDPVARPAPEPDRPLQPDRAQTPRCRERGRGDKRRPVNGADPPPPGLTSSRTPATSTREPQRP